MAGGGGIGRGKVGAVITVTVPLSLPLTVPWLEAVELGAVK